MEIWRIYTSNEQTAVLKELHRLTTFYGSGVGDTGLCNKISVECPDILEVIKPCFPLWDDYSGDENYPIHTNIALTPEQQYDYPLYDYPLYDYKWADTLYGDKRRELCLFLHTTLTKWQNTNYV